MDTKILLAEDDSFQAESFVNHLRKMGLPNEIVHFSNGKLLVDFLNSPRMPERMVIVLDLYMPIMNGFDVLEMVKSCETMRNIPIIVMTTDDNESQIKKCYDLGCNIYVVKRMSPLDLKNAQETIGKLVSTISVERL